MKLLKLIILLLIIPIFGFGQNPNRCGTIELDLLTERLKRNKQLLSENNGVYSRGGDKYIPIKFHLIAKDDGVGRVSESKVFSQLCALNEFYANNNTGVQFYLSGDFEYHDNSDLYFLPSDDSALVPLKSPTAVNVFIVSSIENVGDISPAGYYSPSDDMLVMLKGQVGASSTTLQHEIGHYFSLPHPFNGWDFSGGWNLADHGNPVGVDSPPNPFFPYETVPNEKQDGSNCNFAGDYICDTPPDYLFYISNCNYTGGVMDPDGVPVDPDETNVMSYFGDNCTNYISPDQIALVNTDFDNRPELHNNFTPMEIADMAPVLLVPENNTNQDASFVAFDWDEVPGATHYFFELSRSPDFTLFPIRRILTTSSTFTGGLLEDRTYYWRVKAFNAYETCLSTTPFYTFTTDVMSGTSTIPSLGKWRVDPNPVAQNEDIQLTLYAKKAFDGEIAIVSIAGQTLRAMPYRFVAGTNTISYATEGLDAGMYLVSIQAENARSNQKFVIAR